VGRAEVYINAQKRKDGSYANEETRAIVVRAKSYAFGFVQVSVFVAEVLRVLNNWTLSKHY